MTASLSSRVRLLCNAPPLDRLDPATITCDEHLVQAWQIDLGEELALEGQPQAYVARVVSGSLRLSVADGQGGAFTLRRLHAGEWFGIGAALDGLASATARAAETTRLLAVPSDLWWHWVDQHQALARWCAEHPPLEDQYAALRPLLQARERGEISWLQVVQQLQPTLRSALVQTAEELPALFNAEAASIAWLLPQHAQLLPDSPASSRGCSLQQLQLALPQAPRGLRLIGYPRAAMAELFLQADPGPNGGAPALAAAQQSTADPHAAAAATASGADQQPLAAEMADWQNPDGAQLLALALEQDNPRTQRDRQGIAVKPIFGSSAVEQGLALLQMSCEALRVPFRRDVVDRMLKGMVGDRPHPSLEQIGQIADGLGLSAVLMNLPAAHLPRLALPALLETPDGLLLISGHGGGQLRVIDPLEGERFLDLEILEADQPVYRAVTLARRPRTATKRFGLSYFVPYLQRYRRSLVLVFVASLFINIFGLINPLLIQQIIDKVIGQQNFNTLYFLGVLLIGCSVLSNLLNTIRTYLFTDTTNRIDIATSGNILSHLFRLPLGYFDRRPVGEISTRIAELTNIRGFLTGTALTLVLDVLFGVLYLFVLISYSGLLTAVALAVVPLYIALIYVVSPIIKSQLRIAAEANAAASSLMVESLTGIQTVKAQHAETTLRWKWQQRYARYISSNFRTTLIGTTAGAIGSFFNEVGGLAVLWVGAYLCLKGELTIGQLIAFRIISGNVVGPIIRLAGTWQTIQTLQISVERLSDVVDAPTEQDDDLKPIALPPIQGKVEFDKVSFAFQEHGAMVVKSVAFTVEPGLFVGIVGQSGSGKSTIMKLLPRLYEPAEGVIRIDDYDIAKVDLDSLRQQIGIVPQDSMLFDGSVRDNIALNRPDATDEEVIHAARVACAHAFIMDLPNGYGSPVGERGGALSGGQRQRIAIARAILARPRLLILDEATSALDYLTESTLCENLRRELSSDTVFFITHRLATIRNADRILLMENGLLQESGTHQQLLERRGLYYALYRQQDPSTV